MRKYVEKTMNQYLEEKFAQYADNTAMIYPEGNVSYTFRELQEKVNTLAKGLIAIGVQKETHVALLAPTSPDWILFFLATTKLGGIPVCLNDKNTIQEIKSLVQHSDSTVLVTSTESLGNFYDTSLFDTLDNVIFLEETNSLDSRIMDVETLVDLGKDVADETVSEYVAKTSPDDCLMFLYTSGTTGNPKAVMLGQSRILNNVLTFIDNFGYDEHDNVLSALPLFHVMGCLFTAMLVFMVGGSLVLTKKFSTRRALEVIQEYRVTSFHGVPTMYQFMLNYCADYDVESLKKGMLAGAYCAPEVVADIQDRLGIENIFSCYGQSEGVGFTQIRMEDSNEKKATTVGRAVDGVELKIVNEEGEELPTGEVGEILANMPGCMLGYYKNQEATDATIVDGWIHTGDLGFLDKEGYLTIKGRKKELIIRGGENISPSEIEDVIRTYAMVHDVAVVGAPDKVLGEEIAAFIQMKPGANYIKEEVMEYISQCLPKFKMPKYVYMVEEFPMTSTGKILKRKLVEMLSDQEAMSRMA
jgi:fatty-acyl-CoA synthase